MKKLSNTFATPTSIANNHNFRENPPIGHPDGSAMNLGSSAPSGSPQLPSRRKRELLEHVEATVDEQERWRNINSVYYSTDREFMRFLIPAGKRVLELGCGSGDLL